MKFLSFGKKKASPKPVIPVIVVDLTESVLPVKDVKGKVVKAGKGKQLHFVNPYHKELMKELEKKGAVAEEKVPGGSGSDEQLDVDVDSAPSAEAVAGTVVGASSEFGIPSAVMEERVVELRRRLEAEFEEQLTHLTSTCQLMRDSFDADYQQCVDKLREQFEALLHQASSTEKAGDENLVDESASTSSKHYSPIASFLHGLKSLIPLGRSRTYVTKEKKGGSSEDGATAAVVGDLEEGAK